jgi:hypothetical protein
VIRVVSPRFGGGFLCGEGEGEGRREKGEGRREKGEGRREKGKGRREKGEGRREKGNTRGAAMIELSETFSKRVILV